MWTMVGVASILWAAGFLAGWACCKAWGLHQEIKTQRVSEQYRSSEYRLH